MLDFLTEEIRTEICPQMISLCELRLRAGARIVAVYFGGEVRELNYVVKKDDIERIVSRLVKHTVYAYSDHIKNGYITSDGGERVGICGRCVTENGSVRFIKDVTSLCVRIPRQAIGFADGLMSEFIKGGLCSVMVVSPPGYGKTTFLRDAARGISLKLKKNVLVADEKCEIYSPQFSFGNFCDFMLGCNKRFAFLQGVRNMRPDVILSDELTSVKEVSGAITAALSGVSVIASAHAIDLLDLFKKTGFRDLKNSGAFKKAVVIGKNYDVKISDL